MEHKHMASARGKIHYWIDKSTNAAADTIVFTHGLFCDHTVFRKQIAYFAREYHTLTWDLPFHGLSGTYYGFSYANAVKDLKRILDTEQISKVYLAASSLGGFLSLLFARQYPEMVKGVIAIGSLPLGTEYYSDYDYWYFHYNSCILKLFPEFIIKKWVAFSYAKQKPSRKLVHGILSNYTKEQMLVQSKSFYHRFLKENKEADLKVPVLLLAGENDRTRKIVVYTTEWSKKTGYPLHIISKASHLAHLDNPRGVNLEIESFIMKQREEARKRKNISYRNHDECSYSI